MTRLTDADDPSLKLFGTFVIAFAPYLTCCRGLRSLGNIRAHDNEDRAEPQFGADVFSKNQP